MRFLIAVSLAAALVFVPAANASSCPGAASCPWTQVDTFGDVGNGEFRAPYGMEVDASGNLYVLEQDTHRISKLDPNGGFLTTWGGEGSAAGELWYPWDIAVDAAGGGVYVTDNSNYRVEKFDTSGKFVSAWGWGVADGSAAYQVCTTGCRAGIAGNGSGQFTSPLGIATDGVNVYVADGFNSRIQKYDLAGTVVGQWTIPGAQRPTGLTVAGGKVYVTTRADTIWRFDTNGVPDGSWDGDGVAGSTGTGAGQLNHPDGIAVDASGVYVADSSNHRITKFDLGGAFATMWGTQGAGDGQFYGPEGVLATGSSIWVADSYNHRLQKFSQAGAHQLTVGKPPGPGAFYFPVDVATTSSGDVYVADAAARNIQRLDASGKPIARWETWPRAPYSVTPTSNGVYAPETGDRVSLYDSVGNLLDQFGSTGSGQGQLKYPAGSAADSGGNLYVADRSNHRVQKYDPAGAPLAAFGSYGSGDGQLNTPRDVAIDSSGNVYVADAGNQRIEKFDPTGAFLSKWGSLGSGDGQFDNPDGVAVDANGHVFVSDDRNNRIQEFDANGSFLAKWGTRGAGPGELSRPAGLTVDSDGALWVADENNHRIVRFCCPAAHEAPNPEGGGTQLPPPVGATDTPDNVAPRITLGGRSVQRISLVSRRGLALRIATNERATVTLRAGVSSRAARRLGMRRASIGLSTADLSGTSTQAVRLRLTARARRALLRTRKLRIVVRASAADLAGNLASASLAVTVRR